MEKLENAITYESVQPLTFFVKAPEDDSKASKKITFKRVGVNNNKILQGRFAANYKYQADGIEQSKWFKSGYIKRLLSSEELAAFNRKKEIKKNIETYKSIPISLEQMRKDELVKFGWSIGIEDKTLTKDNLIKAIEEVLA